MSYPRLTDFNLRLHYDEIEGKILHHGYIITFYTDGVLNFVNEKFKIKEAKKEENYRFEDPELFKKLREALENAEFCGLFGDDSWPLYAMKNKEYWEGIFGKGYLEKNYARIGKDLWDDAKDLIITETIIL